MVTDSFFLFACAGMIALLFGLALSLAGYRLFLYLLPVWGFFFGFIFGAQTIQWLLGINFLSTVTSWIVGFVAGAAFALLSYLFYIVAVAIIAGSLGYILAVNFLLWINLPFGFIVWMIGIIAGAAVAVIAIRFNWQKYVVIAATSFLGAAVTVGTIALMFNPALEFLANPIATIIKTSPLLMFLFVLLAVFGFIVQYNSTRNIEAETFYRAHSVEHPQ